MTLNKQNRKSCAHTQQTNYLQHEPVSNRKALTTLYFPIKSAETNDLTFHRAESQ